MHCSISILVPFYGCVIVHHLRIPHLIYSSVDRHLCFHNVLAVMSDVFEYLCLSFCEEMCFNLF